MKRLDVPPGHGTGRFVERRKKQTEIPAIILDGMGGIVPHPRYAQNGVMASGAIVTSR